MRRGGLVLCVLAATFALPARAEYEPHVCRAIYERTNHAQGIEAAEAALDACQRRYMGVVPVDARVRAGERLLRAVVTFGERSIPLLIEYRKPASGGVRLEIGALSDGRRRHAVRLADEAMTRAFEHWQTLEATGVAHTPLPGHVSTNGMETVCFPGGFAADAVVADGRTVTERSLNICDIRDKQYIGVLLVETMTDLGSCAAPQLHDDDAYVRIRRCLSRH